MISEHSTPRDRLLLASETLFLQYGYRGVTMRMIAQEVGMSIGNTYNYFRSKEEIFEVILRPVLDTLEFIFDRHNDDERVSSDIFYDVELTMLKEYSYFIDHYRKELDLLMNHASGSQFEHYKDYFIERNLKLSQEYFALMHQKYPEMRTEFSRPFLYYSVCAWYEMIRYLIQQELSSSELIQFMSEYLSYHAGGWKKLMCPHL